MPLRSINILIVDDSPVVRRVLTQGLSSDPRIGRVDTAPTGSLALRKIAKLDPDVVTMDVEMPGMDGIATLKKIMAKLPRPVVMVSAFTQAGAAKTVRALEIGAVEFVAKPTTGMSRDVAQVIHELIEKIVAVAPLKSKWDRKKTAAPAQKHAPKALAVGGALCRNIVAIGASTGGTEAIRAVLTALPADFPAGIVVVQHMPEGFTASFAARLNELCSLEVKEAANRDLIRPGRVLLAPGHSHMMVKIDDFGAFVELSKGAKMSGHRPSVDILFDSVAESYGSRCVATLLTGMGRDGASGMRRIHEGGGLTVAQDAETCVVFGMPKAAINEGSVDVIAPIQSIGTELSRLITVEESSKVSTKKLSQAESARGRL